MLKDRVKKKLVCEGNKIKGRPEEKIGKCGNESVLQNREDFEG